MRITRVINHFWKWFEQHAESYHGFHTRPEKEINYMLDELNTHLRAYCKYLEAAVGIYHTTGIGILVITANGRERYFDKADKLVAKAPALEGWEIQSLNPPGPPDLMLDVYFPNTSMDPARLWFYPVSDKPCCKKDIIVYSELYTADNKDYKFECAVRMIISNILGERAAALHIGAIYLSNLSEASCKEELMRLEDLPAFVNDPLSGCFEVDERGQLRHHKEKY